MRKLYPVLLALILTGFRFPVTAQALSFYQAQFNGGVTACGYSPDYTSGGTGTLTVSIAPGSTIYQAYLMAGREGPAVPVTVTLNGSSITFDNTNQVSPTFQSIYGGNSGVHAVDVTSIINPAVNTYTLAVPTQTSTSDRFGDFYLYIAYANGALPLVSTAIFVNTVDMQMSITYPLALNYPMGNTTNAGLSLFLGYACNAGGDGEMATVNGTLLGTAGGPNSNSNPCGGPYGDFVYQNATLTGLLDCNADQAIGGPDALSNIQALVANCSSNLSVQMDHAPGGSTSDNAVWAIILAYTAVSQPVNIDTTVCTGTPVQLNLATGGGTVSWAPTTGLSCTNCGNPLASPAVTTTYIATITGGGCGNVSDTITIHIVNSATVTIQNNDTTICSGNAVQLNATSAGNINWSPSAGLSCTACSNPVATPAATTSYIANVGGGSCTASDTVVITVAGAGSNTIVNPTICANSTYTLPNGTVVSTPGTYMDTLSGSGGCYDIVTTNLTIGAATVSAGNDVSVCAGGSTQLNATGGLIYSWTPTTGLSNPNIANPVATPATTTTYTVSSQVPLNNLIVNGDFNAGNTGFSSGYAYTPPPNTTQGQYWVSTNAQPWNGGMAPCGDHTTGTANMLLVNGATNANVSVWCQTVNVTPNTSYAFSTWLATLTASNPAQLQFSINGILLGPVFTASGTNCIWQQFYTTWNSGANTTASICVVNQNTVAAGNDFALDDISFSPLCTGTDTVIVIVSNPDTVILNPSICQGTVYTFPDGTTSGVSSIDTAYLLNQYGCDSNVITNLTVNPSPIMNVPVTICYGTAYVLPSGVAVNTSGVYTDTLFTVAGCDSIIITALTVTPPPVTPVFDTICANQTFTRPSGIVVSTGGIYIDTLIAAGGCDSVVITNLTINPLSATTVYDTICQGSGFTLPDGNVVNTSGTYPVTLANRFGCDSVVTNILTVINLSLVTQESDVLCNGENTGTIDATATGGVLQYNYQLTLNGAAVSNNASGNFNGLAAGSYVMSVTDNFGCSATANTTINQPLPLLISDSAVNVTCYGLRDGRITVNASGGVPAYTYTLDNQSNLSGSFSSIDIGTYQYTVTDQNGCVDSAAVSITQPAAINISIAPDSLVMTLGKSLQLNASSNYDPNAHYLWNPTLGLSCSTCPNPVIKINTTADYNVLVTVNINGNNCTADTTITITVIPDYDIFIPNVFSPNKDGNNDYFQLYGNLPAMKFITVEVFDRWGERVFESNDVNFKWDGIYKGKPVPMGVLVYTLRVVFDDNHTEKLFTGSLTLLR